MIEGLEDLVNVREEKINSLEKESEQINNQLEIQRRTNENREMFIEDLEREINEMNCLLNYYRHKRENVPSIVF